MDRAELKNLLVRRDPEFWRGLACLTEEATGLDELLYLASLRKKAVGLGLAQPGTAPDKLRLALLGGCSLYPLHEALTHLLAVAGVPCELFVGDYDNYVAEIREPEGALHRFRPDVTLLLPGPQRCKYTGTLHDEPSAIRGAADAVVTELLDLCRTLHERAGGEVILANFPLPARHDPGPFRAGTLASDWAFRKWVNLHLGLQAPECVRLCDLEFLGCRLGGLVAEDARGWFESKQPGSPAMLVQAAREIARLILGLRAPMKKVLVLDLDNTLWGGVVADDGLEGIEIGDTSPRGEAFKAFQRHILTLKQRGVLLAVCSKNDTDRALEPFQKHPEMLLRVEDFAAFKANWEPKSDNLRALAGELQLGLDSFVFADDNPAEIEIVRQFAPEVTTLLLGADPADYVAQLQDGRWFEPHRLTAEDAQRTAQYRAESARQSLQSSVADMDAYLESLAMEAVIQEFTALDVPRLAQLINKSNQFNLTTRRRSEAEVQGLIGRPEYLGLAVRLKDRFGDHGLISIIIGQVRGEVLEFDTWLMSCRVLKRQVEETVLNEVVRHARARGCTRLQGIYRPTAKNEMVREFYPRMGFARGLATDEQAEFALELPGFAPRPTKIKIINPHL